MSDVTYWFDIWNRKLWLLIVSRRKDSNSRGWGDGLSQAYLVGSFTGKEKEMNLETGRRWGCKKKNKNPLACSEIFCCESCHQGFSSQVHSLKSSLGLRNHLENYTRQGCGTIGLIIYLPEKICCFWRMRLLCKMPHWPLLGNFLFSLIHVVFCIMLKAHKLYYSYVHKTKSTFK